ncbi:MAG: MBL fold metallo-hydrolase [Eubacteriales bacterium]
MKITWLGQAGLLLETEHHTVMIDPYLSDSVGTVNPKCHRRVPVNAAVFDTLPDILIFTHNHLDHYDPETVSHFLTAETKITVLSPLSVWNEVRKIGGGNNYVCFNHGTEWTVDVLRFSAVKAEHSDPDAIGVVIDDLSENRTYYITGDTLYNRTIFTDLPNRIDAVFLPINGVGNNMNMTDAARFASAVGAKYAVPLHWGLFDALNGADFPFENKIVPEFFREIKIP